VKDYLSVVPKNYFLGWVSSVLSPKESIPDESLGIFKSSLRYCRNNILLAALFSILATILLIIIIQFRIDEYYFNRVIGDLGDIATLFLAYFVLVLINLCVSAVISSSLLALTNSSVPLSINITLYLRFLAIEPIAALSIVAVFFSNWFDWLTFLAGILFFGSRVWVIYVFHCGATHFYKPTTRSKWVYMFIHLPIQITLSTFLVALSWLTIFWAVVEYRG
jgi:hypothetical protein